ncbi:hypothetical protein FRACYDRAFT_236371 [Fragilariopsis cylindrus CCMP1102]|uniref:Uncharacterized protein n=1 Tax=Fragilariopsis cylindrus CCMP1102 TaxID=635003 RepID=A0A1E7FQ72_9STRA|nr:hypothetical protein FRACYDRAFT_236371 [Fragilariopsis cylindrus CCMP1102]|eukprot:OEU20296.1 hypothetical protein FRACYDRAFT_236371 [Fragilariopsis cylindrus CCMP1102]
MSVLQPGSAPYLLDGMYQSVLGEMSYPSSIKTCDDLSIGSYFFININAWPTVIDVGYGTKANNTHHGEIILFGFEDIPGGIDLFLTDKPWSTLTNKFINEDVVGEGILKLTTPLPVGIPAGIPFGIGNGLDNDWNWIDYKVNGMNNMNTTNTTNTTSTTNNSYYFDLGYDGDQIFLYCIDSNGNDRPLTGISYNGPFISTTTSNFIEFGTNTSSAPDYLLNNTINNNNTGTLVMPSSTTYLNWQYIGPMTGNSRYN